MTTIDLIRMSEKRGRVGKRVRVARWTNEDTGEITPVYAHSHDEIDQYIDQWIRIDPGRIAELESVRTKHHAALDAA